MRPDLRYQGAQYSLPVHIGENVWIGDKDREYFYKNRKLDVWE